MWVCIIMNILVTGSRELFGEKQRIFIIDKLNQIIKKDDIIIHGGASGVDACVEYWCMSNHIKSLIVRPVDVTKKENYLYRNCEMVAMCDKCIAFWDGYSRGTKFTFEYAQKRNKPVEIYKLENE